LTAEYSKNLIHCLNQLTSGVKIAANGATQIATGANTLQTKSEQLVAGAGQLASGSAQLAQRAWPRGWNSTRPRTPVLPMTPRSSN